MRRRTHLFLGLLAFLLYLYLITGGAGLSGDSRANGLGATLAGALLPDLLEPATSANHRGFFHSRGAAAGVAALFCTAALLSSGVLLLPGLPSGFVPSCFLLGYLCHLLADSLTPRGLPG